MNRLSKLFFTLFLGVILCISGFLAYGQDKPLKDYPIQPVSFTKVKVNDHSWANRGSGAMNVWMQVQK